MNYSSAAKFLGLHFDRHLNWKVHVRHLAQETTCAVSLLKYLMGTAWGADRKYSLMLYKSLICSEFDYGAQVCGMASQTTHQPLSVLQNRSLRLSIGALWHTRISRIAVESLVPPLQSWPDYLSPLMATFLACKHYLRIQAWHSEVPTIHWRWLRALTSFQNTLKRDQ